MRRILALSALLATAASPALALQDRYGPPRPVDASYAAPAPLPAGATLNWNGKTAATAPVAPSAPIAPQPLTPLAYRLQPAPQLTQAVAAYAPPVPAAYRQAIPQSAAAPRLEQQVSAPPLPPQAQAPAPIARPAVQAAPAVAAPGEAAYDARPRFYSVARQYGGAPDPISVGQPRRGEALTLAEPPVSPGLGRTFAPLDDGRPAQAVEIPDTKRNAAANRVSRLGF